MPKKIRTSIGVEWSEIDSDYFLPVHGMSMVFAWFGFRFNQDNVDKTQSHFSRLTLLAE